MHCSKIALASALAFAAYPLAAVAEDTENTAAADDGTSDSAESGTGIIVVGQRDRPIEIAPRGLAVSLGDEQLEAVNAFNTEDLMKYAPNFFVRKRFSGDSNGVPGFRGTHSTQSARTLVMVDGFVVSNFLGNSFGFSPKWGVVGPGEVRQFDIVYGPYSSRYVGNSMGGIVNITTRDPEKTEAFATVQGFAQPYEQFGTDDTYYGYSAEAGVGWKQEDGPHSARLTGRYFRNTGQPMMWYGLIPLTGASGTVVTGAIVDPKQVEAIQDGTGLANQPPARPGLPAPATPAVPGSPTNPIFAGSSPSEITQAQAKLKLGYDDGVITGQFLFAYWHNEDRGTAPECYLRDAASNVVCEGRVTIGAQTYTASGITYTKTLRDEFLAGLKLGVPLGDDTSLRATLSTYQIARSDGFASTGYITERDGGAGTLTDQGPTGWWTGDLAIEHKPGGYELATGVTFNAYRTDQTRYTLPVWFDRANAAFSTRTFGKTRQLSAWTEGRLLLEELTITAGLRYDDWRAYDGGLTRLGTGAQAGQQVGNA